jgi:protease-4
MSALVVGSPGCIYVSGAISPFGHKRRPLQETGVSGEGRDKILLLDVSGIISGQEREQALGLASEESTVARVQEALRVAREDERVRAVVLRIESPGGEVTASDTLYREIMRFKAETERPVIAALMDVATSGAYYAALAADRIVVNPTTVTGSVGVILVGLNVQGLMTKLGIRDQTVKSGAHKDLLSPFRDATAEERAIVQGVIAELHERFVGLVIERRPAIAAADLERVTDGRIFTASQAAALGLVDDIGYVDDAITLARQAAGVERARVVMYHRVDEYRENIYSYSRANLPGAAARPGLSGDGDVVSLRLRLPARPGPRFMYLWAPGTPAAW